MDLNGTIPGNFIEDEIVADIANGKTKSVYTRFPPEPNGYLHIGHAKSICLNFGIKQKFNGKCNLRFDDTNPVKEDTEYVDSIMEDIRWLGFEWDELLYASSYFEKLYEYAVQLIKAGKAYVCDLNAQQMRETRGTLTMAGENSPYRERSVEENIRLFTEMREGKFGDGEKVLRAKIDMESPNLNMRDPVMYRILRASHHMTGDDWLIYPMYDYAHPVSDAIEGISHSICTLEFEDHRPLYNWFVENIGFENPPRQIEFARLNLTNTIMSKRYLKQLVDGGKVEGWDDPRMPTICGLRRRGYTPESIRSFAEKIGVAKANSTVDHGFLEFCLREDLGTKAKRVMAVMRPLKVTISNYPEDTLEDIALENNPEDENAGMRNVCFGREIYIEQDDFMEEPVKKFFRLAPGKEVRLKGAYIIKCEEVVKDEKGDITELICTYDPDTKSGSGSDRKVKGTLHWVEAKTAVKAEIRLYDSLLLDEAEVEGDKQDFTDRLNIDSVTILQGYVEKKASECAPGEKFQFLRQGYFCRDEKTEGLRFNRIVGLKDTWAKMQGGK